MLLFVYEIDIHAKHAYMFRLQIYFKNILVKIRYPVPVPKNPSGRRLGWSHAADVHRTPDTSGTHCTKKR